MKKRRAFIKFLKDNLLFSIIYFITMALIVLFYHLTSDSKVEILYPLSITLYGYLIIMTVKGISYISFFKKLDKSIHNPEYQLQPHNAMQREVSSVINRLHNQYINQLNTLKADSEWQQRFLSQWVHELKTYIAVIDLTSQKELMDLDDARESLICIAEENDRLHHSVEQLLSLIRLNNFEKDYNPEKVDLVTEIRHILGGLKKRFVINNIFPEIALETEDTTVFTDKKWHSLMLEQFLSNAIKYTKAASDEAERDIQMVQMQKKNIGPEDTKAVDIQSEDTRPEDSQMADILPEDIQAADIQPEQVLSYHRIWLSISSSKDDLLLTIRDEGIGIPSYDLNRIFEPFFTGDNGRRVKNSTGIGLYIADSIAKRLGHRIEVSSKPGEGTSVLIAYQRR